MSSEEELQRQIGINLQLRRKLESARRDVVEECAKFCEEHEAVREMGHWYLELGDSREGSAYAKGLRALINQGE